MTPLRLREENTVTCSVLICAYNARATIREAIESVQAQTLRDIDVIVIDDGSSDDTASTVADLSAHDPRLRLIRQANAGVAAARNRAVEEARGVAIAFLDADDRWREDHLRLHVKALATTDVEITFARARFIDGLGRSVGDRSRHERQQVTAKQLLSGNPCTTCSTMVMLRSVFATVDGFDQGLRRAEDQEWLLRAAVRGCKIVGTGETSVDYRNSPHGLSADLDQMLAAFRRVLSTVSSYAPDLVNREAPRAEASLRLYLARKPLRLGSGRLAAVHHLIQALKTYPRVALQAPLRIIATLAGIAVPTLSVQLIGLLARASST